MLELGAAVAALYELLVDELQVLLHQHKSRVLDEEVEQAVFEEFIEEVMLEVDSVAHIDDAQEGLQGVNLMLPDEGLQQGFY